MKRFLLPESGTFYKANLHCHTNLSDGHLSPEEVKRIYKEQGYSIVAYTDHDLFIPHPELADPDFLPLHAMEMEINEETPLGWDHARSCHLCFIALKEDTVLQPCWHRSKYRFGNAPGNAHLARFDESLPDYERAYTPERINDMIRTCREQGFFVTYNHPTWSLEGYEQYIHLEGMQAMEICNYSCMVMGYEEYNPRVYDELLRAGKRLYCVATDDNHNHGTPGARTWDSFGGFTMIKAPSLQYEAVTAALENGDFYASQGPQIHSLYLEGDTVHIECSPADRINLHVATRRDRLLAAEPGAPVTHAAFQIHPDDGYFRITVTDAQGRHADTRAYFLDELLLSH